MVCSILCHLQKLLNTIQHRTHDNQYKGTRISVSALEDVPISVRAGATQISPPPRIPLYQGIAILAQQHIQISSVRPIELMQYTMHLEI